MIAFRIKKVQFSVGFLILLAAVLILDEAGAILWVLPPVLFHELGHYLAIKQYGGSVTSLTFMATGAEIKYGNSINCGYGGELFITLAGSMFSFMLAIIASLFGRAFLVEDAYAIAGISFVLGAFNLLPALPLDGGRALYIIAAALFSVNAAEKLLFVTSALVSLSTLILGALALMKTGANFTIIAAGIFTLSQLAVQLGIENNRRMI